MDKMSQHQQDIMDGFMAAVGSGAKMTIRMHYQSPQYFAQALEASLIRYDWYILFPHFSQDESTMQKIRELIERIPPQYILMACGMPKGQVYKVSIKSGDLTRFSGIFVKGLPKKWRP